MKRAAASIAFLIVAAAPTFAQIEVVPDIGTLYAYDAKGKLVGAFTPSWAAGGVILGVVRLEVVGEGLIYLPVAHSKAGLVWNSPPLWFASADCTGLAYGKHTTTSVGDHTAYVGLGGMLYIGEPDGGADDVVFGSFNSRVITNEEGKPVCEQEHTSTGVPLRQIGNLDAAFEPPFTTAPTAKVRAARH